MNFHRTTHGLPQLTSGIIHVFIASRATLPNCDELLAALPSSERTSASRLVCDERRNEFVTSRALLRMVLGGYLNMLPIAVPLKRGSEGKLHLGSKLRLLQFSVTHQDGLLIIAACQKARIGIDVERFRRSADLMDIAELYFSRRETKALQRCASTERRADLFYRYWTGKEAVVKAKGKTICDETLRIVDLSALKDVHAFGERWRIRWFLPANHYIASIASDRVATAHFWTIECKKRTLTIK